MMHISGSGFPQDAQFPAEKQSIQMYQKKDGTFDLEVQKKKKGLARLAQKLTTKIRHRNANKMHADFTSKVLFKAAVLQEGAKTGEMTPEGTVGNISKIDQVAYALIESIGKEFQGDKPPDLVKISENYDLAHAHKLDYDEALVAPMIEQRESSQLATTTEKIQENVIEAFSSLKDTSTEMAETPAPNGASGLMKTAEGLIHKTDKVPSALSDTWRSCDKITIIGASGRVIFDGPNQARATKQAQKNRLLNQAGDLLKAHEEHSESHPLPEGFRVKSMQEYENPNEYQTPQLQLAAFLEQQEESTLMSEVEQQFEGIISGELARPEGLPEDFPADCMVLNKEEKAVLKQHLLTTAQTEKADAMKREEDIQRGERAKGLIIAFAQEAVKTGELTSKQSEDLIDNLEAWGPWSTNSEASRWATQWMASQIGEDEFPASFIGRLRSLSQDHSTGLYVHSSRLEHTASQRKNDLRLNENQNVKSFTYRFQNDGTMRMTIAQTYEVMHLLGLKKLESQIFPFKGNGSLMPIWIFKAALMKQKVFTLRTKKHSRKPQKISCTNRVPNDQGRGELHLLIKVR